MKALLTLILISLAANGGTAWGISLGPSWALGPVNQSTRIELDNGRSAAMTRNPAAASVRVNQNALTQPPTIIMKRESVSPIECYIIRIWPTSYAETDYIGIGFIDKVYWADMLNNPTYRLLYFSGILASTVSPQLLNSTRDGMSSPATAFVLSAQSNIQIVADEDVEINLLKASADDHNLKQHLLRQSSERKNIGRELIFVSRLEIGEPTASLKPCNSAADSNLQ